MSGVGAVCIESLNVLFRHSCEGRNPQTLLYVAVASAEILGFRLSLGMTGWVTCGLNVAHD